MKIHKRFWSVVLLASLVGGVSPTLPVYATEIENTLSTSTSNTQVLTEPDGSGSDYRINGDNIDMYLPLIESMEPSDGLYQSLSNHAKGYSDRLKGLCALALNMDDITEYQVAIDLALADSNFQSSQTLTSVTIGGNTVSFDLGYAGSAAFLHRKDIFNNASNDDVQKQKYEAVAKTAAEFIYYADEWRKDVNTYMGSHNGKITASDVALLDELHEAFLFAGNGRWDDDGQINGAVSIENFRFIIDLWFASGSDGDLGLKELWEHSKDSTNIDVENVYGDVVVESGQPLINFYKVNSATGISSVDIHTMAGESDDPGLGGGMNRYSGLIDETYGEATDALNTMAMISSMIGDSQMSYVTIGENIMRGVSYSAGYIPMQTNLYSTATINGYDRQWLTDWHYRYGFMRKALYRDTSSTSAMDYYNSLGTSKGNLKVCTLRDFMELGEKDLTLYVDTSFYNMDEACETWVVKKSADRVIADTFIADVSDYLSRSFGKDETSDEYDYIDAEFISDAYDLDLSSMNEEQINKMIASLKRALRADENTDDFTQLVKGGDYDSYDTRVRSKLALHDGAFISNASNTMLEFNNHDNIVLSSYDISEVLDGVTTRTETGDENTMIDYEYVTYDEYTPMFSFAYVSAIYRSSEAFKVSTLNELGSPVFIASDDVAQLRDATLYDRSSLLNYMLVRNLPSMVQINYTYSMDMDSPVYMDIYGNIISESGLVVVPAACNATLYPNDYCSSMYAIGLFSCYGNDYFVPSTLENVEELLSYFFKIDEQNEVWQIDGKGVNVNGTLVDFANIAAYTGNTQKALQAAFTSYLYSDNTSTVREFTHVLWPKWVNLINEVMRGAPLEHINKTKEGIQTNSIINKTSIVAAAKLESLIDSLEGSMSNTLLCIPDFTSMEQSEYVVAFVFKFLMVAIVCVIMFHIYQDAMAGFLGLRTIMKSAWAVGLTALAVAGIPALFQLTYYTANKLLLQDEVAKICMYNLEKEQSGIEVRVLETDVPSTNNKIMVQLDWLTVPWYDEIYNLLFGTSSDTLDVARKEAAMRSAIAVQPDVLFYNDGVYMDVNDIFNSVGMDYTFNVGEMTSDQQADTLTGEAGANPTDALNESLNKVNDTKATKTVVNGLYLYDNGTQQSLSFYSPYYVFLKALTANVNYYNQSHNRYMYTTKLQSGNRLKTVGLCSAYFQSESFMELDPDILHLYEVYELPKEAWYDNGVVFYTEELELMRNSTWYITIDKENVQKRIELVNDYCRDFVADNRELLDKVTDETFIKVMALTMSMKYNQVFGITEANCFDIFDMNSNDLLRLSIADPSTAMLSSPLSYSRYVLTTGGEAAVYAASVLTMVMYIGSFVKPACVVITFISVLLSLFINKIVLRRKDKTVLGYLITVLLLGSTNVLHAIILKMSTKLPLMGLSTLGCILGILVFQMAYLMILACVVATALRDWRNLGATNYEEAVQALKYKLTRKDKNHLSAQVPRYDNNWDYYDALVEQHRERNDGF